MTGHFKISHTSFIFRNTFLPAPIQYIIFIFLFILTLNTTCVFSLASASDDPFTTASNRGGTGLFETPNARVMDEGSLRLGYSGASPYNWYYISLGALPGTEVSINLTDVRNIRAYFFNTYKDRGFDLKFQILHESKKYPAIAVGIQDFLGTRLFPSEYIVMSRQFLPFDFSLGLGHKRLRGPLHLPFLDEVGLFGGVEMALHEKLKFIAEYNPVEYEKDRGNVRGAVPGGAKIPANFGIVSKIVPGMDIGISYQRGDVLGFTINLYSELGKPVQHHRPDPPAQVPAISGPTLKDNGEEIINRIIGLLSESHMTNISVLTDGKEIIAEFENNYYMSNQKAVGRVLRILCFQSTPDTRKITAIVKRRGLHLLSVSIDPAYMKKYLYGELPRDIFYRLLNIKIVTTDENSFSAGFNRASGGKNNRFRWGIKPEIETFIGDQTQYVQFRTGVKPWTIIDIWKGAQVYARYDIPFYSNAVSTAEIPDDAVRSDTFKYLGTYDSFDRLMVDQIYRLSGDTFSRVSFGYFERAYAGVGGEILSFLDGGRYAIGLEADWVRKRDPGTQLGLLDLDTYTFLSNFYYHMEKWNVTANAKIGRFMYGDFGALFQVSREFNTGAGFSFWFSYTDSDKFTEFNKGSNRTGFSLTIPIRMFLAHDSRQKYTYSVSPWTRDVAATLFHWQDIYGVVSDLTPSDFRSNIEQIEE